MTNLLYAELDKLKVENIRLKEVLREAKLQIEYLHEKFQETGTGNTVIARIDAALKESA